MALNWKIRDGANDSWAKFEACGFKLFVMDQDGDGSAWSVKYRGVELADGIIYEAGESKYHFELAMDAAEKAFRIAFDNKELKKQIKRFQEELKSHD